MIEHNFYKNYYGDIHGDVYSKKSGEIKKLKKRLNKHGYEYVALRVNKKTKSVLVHRFICSLFKENKSNKEQVNHIDGNKRNNHINNLEWVTAKENTKHAFEKGLRNSESLKSNGMKLSRRISQIDIITGDVIRVWESSKEPGRILGDKFNSPAILRCCKLIKNTHKGFIWRFEGDENKKFNVSEKTSLYKVEVYENESLLKTFESAREVADFYSVALNSVYRSLNEKRLFRNKFILRKVKK